MTAYYNEFDPGAAAWLRELIKRGLIAAGEVDERSILDVTADDLKGFTQCHFFAGIGGWSYALRLAGIPDDMKVWTGSPPCQPFSTAGQQKGKDDERHLAPHFASLVASGQPPILFGEQVASAAVFGKAARKTRIQSEGEPEWAWIDDLQDRLEAAHYAVGASDIPAAGVGAPHIRQRAFFGAVRLADSASEGLEGATREIIQGRSDGHASSSETLRLADACGEYLRGESGERIGSTCSTQGEARKWEWSGPDDSCGGSNGRLADSTGEQRELQSDIGPSRVFGEGVQSTQRGDRLGDLGTASFRLADADNAGSQGRPGMPERADQRLVGQNGMADAKRPCSPHNPWRDADWLFCRDGKWRPVEPGTQPLAHGIPARVVRLRGYGNAIVPQAAAQFVRAFLAAAP